MTDRVLWLKQDSHKVICENLKDLLFDLFRPYGCLKDFLLADPDSSDHLPSVVFTSSDDASRMIANINNSHSFISVVAKVRSGQQVLPISNHISECSSSLKFSSSAHSTEDEVKLSETSPESLKKINLLQASSDDPTAFIPSSQLPTMPKKTEFCCRSIRAPTDTRSRVPSSCEADLRNLNTIVSKPTAPRTISPLTRRSPIINHIPQQCTSFSSLSRFRREPKLTPYVGVPQENISRCRTVSNGVLSRRLQREGSKETVSLIEYFRHRRETLIASRKELQQSEKTVPPICKPPLRKPVLKIDTKLKSDFLLSPVTTDIRAPKNSTTTSPVFSDDNRSCTSSCTMVLLSSPTGFNLKNALQSQAKLSVSKGGRPLQILSPPSENDCCVLQEEQSFCSLHDIPSPQRQTNQDSQTISVSHQQEPDSQVLLSFSVPPIPAVNGGTQSAPLDSASKKEELQLREVQKGDSLNHAQRADEVLSSPRPSPLDDSCDNGLEGREDKDPSTTLSTTQSTTQLPQQTTPHNHESSFQQLKQPSSRGQVARAKNSHPKVSNAEKHFRLNPFNKAAKQHSQRGSCTFGNSFALLLAERHSSVKWFSSCPTQSSCSSGRVIAMLAFLLYMCLILCSKMPSALSRLRALLLSYFHLSAVAERKEHAELIRPGALQQLSNEISSQKRREKKLVTDSSSSPSGTFEVQRNTGTSNFLLQKFDAARSFYKLSPHVPGSIRQQSSSFSSSITLSSLGDLKIALHKSMNKIRQLLKLHFEDIFIASASLLAVAYVIVMTITTDSWSMSQMNSVKSQTVLNLD